MDNILQTALAEAVNGLANFFGTTTESIMAHMPEFLAKYGWYSTLNSLSDDVIVAIFVGLFLCFLGGVIYFLSDATLEHPRLAIISIIAVSVILTIAVRIAPCAVAPEIVGAHAILDLLKSVK